MRLILLSLFLLVCESQAAVAFRSMGFVIVTSTTSVTVTEPAACASGDMEVAMSVSDSGSAPVFPSGWTNLYPATTQGLFVVIAGYISRGGSAPSLVFTYNGNNAYKEVYVLCLTGSATVIFDSKATIGATGFTDHQPDPPATTAVATTSMAVAMGVNWGGSITGGWTASTNYVIRSNNANGNDGFMETRSLSASGSENPAAVSNGHSGIIDWWNGGTVTFTDAGGAASPPQRALLGVGK